MGRHTRRARFRQAGKAGSAQAQGPPTKSRPEKVQTEPEDEGGSHTRATGTMKRPTSSQRKEHWRGQGGARSAPFSETRFRVKAAPTGCLCRRSLRVGVAPNRPVGEAENTSPTSGWGWGRRARSPVIAAGRGGSPGQQNDFPDGHPGVSTAHRLCRAGGDKGAAAHAHPRPGIPGQGGRQPRQRPLPSRVLRRRRADQRPASAAAAAARREGGSAER